MAYTYLDGNHLDNSTATNTFTVNLGSAGSKFFIVGAFTQSGAPIAGISVNSIALSLIVDNTVGTAIWTGIATALGTGLDQVLMTGTGSVAFGDTMISVYTASGLSSNTPYSSAFGGSGASFVTTNAVIGYYAFAFVGTNPAVTYGGTAQAPTGTPPTQTGVNGGVLSPADWILTSTGVPATTFTVTTSGPAQTCVAVWAPGSGVVITNLTGIASAEW